MNITFDNTKLENLCNTYRSLVKDQGADRASRIKRRLDDLRAADTLEDMRYLPGRCHELRENRAGQLSLDLDHPYRLIFVPANEPIPRKEDGGFDWTRITAVRILGVEDTHR